MEASGFGAVARDWHWCSQPGQLRRRKRKTCYALACLIQSQNGWCIELPVLVACYAQRFVYALAGSLLILYPHSAATYIVPNLTTPCVIMSDYSPSIQSILNEPLPIANKNKPMLKKKLLMYLGTDAATSRPVTP